MIFGNFSSQKIVYFKSDPLHPQKHQSRIPWRRNHVGLLLGSFILLLVINGYLLTSYFQYKHILTYRETIFNEIQNANSDLAVNTNQKAAVLGAFDPQVGVVDGRAANLKRILRKYNSPLYDSAEYMVAKADEYKFHYGLLFAIAMQESQGCKAIPPGSHNCWGYGIYGDKVTTFDSYEEAIDVVSTGLYNNYIQKGLTTPEQIMKKYTPSSNGSWAYAVNFFFDKLEE